MGRYDWKRYLFCDVHRVIGFLPVMLWFRPKVRYVSDTARKRVSALKHRGGAVMVLSHSSHSDPTYVQVCLPVRHKNILTADDLVKSRFVNWIMKKFGGILISRKRFSPDSYREILGLLGQDRLVFVYPEGQIVRGEEMGPFRTGFVTFARESGKPVVPMYIPRRHNPFRRLVILFGEPLDPEELKDGSPQEIAGRVRKTIIDMKKQLESEI